MKLQALACLIFLGLAARGPIYGDLVAPGVRPQPTESEAAEAPQGINFPNFKPIEFPFFTTVPDDGTGKAGGYQVAKVNLEFIKIMLPRRMTKWYVLLPSKCRYGLSSWGKSTQFAQLA